MGFRRYGIYFTPTPGPFAEFGAAWLGWDINAGRVPPPPDIPELTSIRQEITQTPGKYGLHATIKPPFRLADGQTEAALCDAFETLCAQIAPVTLDHLTLARLGRFLALVPEGDTSDLCSLAAHTVRELDVFRAPLTDKELARRRARSLSPEQDANLIRWGYPYVMNTFRFHITLTGKIPKKQADWVQTILESHLMPHVPSPYDIDAFSLVGESSNGRFHILRRCKLKGKCV
ncbi:DUF1045 domain-containing protein [Roseovarius phycicola]|uniref:DUF1045 domain-containing protein n=1 Tax=Roseovarius phycicola TaxID=3080976 RepID=A0ABZ2HIC8_9RHOB